MAQRYEPMEIDTDDIEGAPHLNPAVIERISCNLGVNNYRRGHPHAPETIVADNMELQRRYNLLEERNANVQNTIRNMNTEIYALLQQRSGSIGQARSNAPENYSPEDAPENYSPEDAPENYSPEDAPASYGDMLQALQIIAQGFEFQLGDANAITKQSFSRLINHVFPGAAMQGIPARFNAQLSQLHIVPQMNNMNGVEVQLQLVMQSNIPGAGDNVGERVDAAN